MNVYAFGVEPLNQKTHTYTHPNTPINRFYCNDPTGKNEFCTIRVLIKIG